MDKSMNVITGNRLKGAKPRIGIRPTLEGRAYGVRESLETQTMNMAQSVKRLLESSLMYSFGEPVECVISDTTISGVAEAMQAEEKFQKENVQVSITVSPCWCYGAEVIDTDAFRPKAIWGFNGTERPGAVFLAAAVAAHNQKGLPVFGIYGEDVQDKDDESIPDDVKAKLLRFAKAAVALVEMRDKSYLSIGSVSMGIAGSIVSDSFFQKYLGMRNEYVDMSEVLRRMNLGIYDQKEFNQAKKWAQENLRFGEDKNPPDIRHTEEKKEESLDNGIRLSLVIKDLMAGNPALKAQGYEEESHGHNALASGFQGQRNWTDFLVNGDFSEAMLNSSFDWNGIRQPYIVATENDSLNGASMMMANLMTGSAQVFADVRTYWSPAAVKRVTGYELEGDAKHGFIHMINSGPAALDGTGAQTKDGAPFIKPFWEVTGSDVENCIDQTEFRYADVSLFSGGGYSTDFMTKGKMPMTACRLNLMDGLGPYMQIAEGYSIDLPEQVADTIDSRTDPTWPTTWFVPRLTGTGAFKNVYTMMNKWGANHASLCAGHIGADLITLCAMLRIPVAMHNVDEAKMLRPRNWDAFGTLDAESVDYRACQILGPLYG